MNCVRSNEKSQSRSKEESFKYLDQSGGEGVAGVEIQTSWTIDKRVHRVCRQEQIGNTRGKKRVGKNVDQLIYSVKGQITANKAAIKEIASMHQKLLEREDELEASLDQLIEIRETSQNVE